jgi:hypothetical protein
MYFIGSHTDSQGKQNTGNQKKYKDKLKWCVIDHVHEPVAAIDVS